MTKIYIGFIALNLFVLACTQQHQTRAERIRQRASHSIHMLQQMISGPLLRAAKQNNPEALKASFLKCRAQFKKMEFYVEYFFPATARVINGAPIDEIELGENLVEPPGGFQVIEALIYDEPDTAALANEIRKMTGALKRMEKLNEAYALTDAQIFDAMRLEIFRITALGITGFDTPSALESLPETVAALEGLKSACTIYGSDEVITGKIMAAIVYLKQHNDFNTFDRLTFITDYLQPLSKTIDKHRRKLKIESVSGNSALGDEAISLFEAHAFNINKFTGNHTEFISDEKIALGKRLFHDRILSNSGRQNCASCHRENAAFTDSLKTAAGIGQTLLRNTPTLKYAGLQRAFFYDLKAGTLEDQALDVIHNRAEMDGSLTDAATRINSDATYRQLFDSSGATPWKIQHALASYIRSLSPFSSRLDRYMRGDRSSLDETEKHGFNLFMGKAKCGTCHFAPVFNGTPPPFFERSEGEVLGVPAQPDTANAVVDADLGRYALNAFDQYKHAFKTPTIRNIAITAPYMHNGVYRTLEEVVDFYNRGGGAGIGINLDNQTLAGDPLNLSDAEKKALIAFMKTLTD